MTEQRMMTHSVHSATLADVLERVLDKGLVIAGDIKIKLVDIELLTIQIRLVVCSVEKAKEIGIDWWTRDKNLSGLVAPKALPEPSELQLASLHDRMENLETMMAKLCPPSVLKS
jgi:hypothetical protein